jgi:acyl-CoA hydrolase
MTQSSKSRAVRESLVQMTELVLPEDTNARGSIFGGRVLALIDKCAAAVALRHARSPVVTATLDSVVFIHRVHLGEILMLRGRINAVFGSSMEIEVEVHAEDPMTGVDRLTTTAFVTMVSVSDDGRPQQAPRIEFKSEAEAERAEEALERRRARLASRTARTDRHRPAP